ncbi:hypothetical protein GCM10027296_19600 [Chitinimonas naiadis]
MSRCLPSTRCEFGGDSDKGGNGYLSHASDQARLLPKIQHDGDIARPEQGFALGLVGPQQGGAAAFLPLMIKASNYSDMAAESPKASSRITPSGRAICRCC